ncbi:MAG: DUF262 domain-containing protein [Methanomassiliicoccales archaeon]|jgi:hypothetical protein
METSTIPISGLRGAYPDLGVAGYQRSTVWSASDKAAFIGSLMRDYPTGIIILYRYRMAMPSNIMFPKMSQKDTFSHDIIDGQQRLNTIFEFLDNPLVYILDWVKKPRKNQVEEPAIQQMRDEFNNLVTLLKPKMTSKKKSEASEEVFKTARKELTRTRVGEALLDPNYERLVDRMKNFETIISQRKMVIQELDDIDPEITVQIYYLINSTGQDILWWEQLKTNDRFLKDKYVSKTQYNTMQDNMVEKISRMYRGKGKIAARPTTNDSFWDAFFTVGEYLQLILSGEDPKMATGLIPRNGQKLKIDGLGFRLVSGHLTHDLRRVVASNIREVIADADKLREAVDLLICTGDLLTNKNASNRYKLFLKYSEFKSDIIPAYPLAGLILIAAQMGKLNRDKDPSRGFRLLQNDELNLRVLTEELFREMLCTEKWAGTGDSKLKEWLDSHIDSNGRVIANSTYEFTQWKSLLDSLSPSNKRQADKKDMLFSLWMQYLFDAYIPGSLPRGDISFDHIVPFQDSQGSLTTHPLNIIATTVPLNTQKLKKSYLEWDPSRIQKEYMGHCLNEPRIASTSPNAPANDFLSNADHGRLTTMIGQRRGIFEYGLKILLPQWLTSGE